MMSTVKVARINLVRSQEDGSPDICSESVSDGGPEKGQQTGMIAVTNLLQMSKSAICDHLPSGHFASMKGRVVHEDSIRPLSMCEMSSQSSKDGSKDTIKVSGDWLSGNPKKMLTGVHDSLDEFPLKKSTLKLALFGKEQKMADRNLIITMKGDETPLETEEASEEMRDPHMLQLEVIEGLCMPSGTQILLHTKGLVGSKRKARDQCAYFGTMKTEGKSPILVDYVIPEEEKGVGKKHFVIKYDSAKQIYMIKDLGDGHGTFIKVAPSLKLCSGHVISFGEVHFSVNIKLADAKGPSEIEVKFIEGPKAGQKHKFKASSRPITLGRQKGSVLHFVSGSLSRRQCQIEFKDSGWYIVDGDGKKGSTNGTWLFANEFFEIRTGMIFKAAQVLFKATSIDTSVKS